MIIYVPAECHVGEEACEGEEEALVAVVGQVPEHLSRYIKIIIRRYCCEYDAIALDKMSA